MRKIIWITSTSILLIVVESVTVDFSHPILNKWIFGAARIIGKPIKAIIYTNGMVNNSIKVFHDSIDFQGQKSYDYILTLKDFDKKGMLRYINVNLDQRWVGRPVAQTASDYDMINGLLWQSDAGGHFVDFKDDMKGFNFDPQLTFTSKEIKFRVPLNQLKFDSVRIELK